MNVKALSRLSPAVRPGGLMLWVAVVTGVAAWAAHILLLSALARWTCNEDGSRWVLDVLTLVTAVATVAAIWLCLGIVRGAEADEAEGTPAARTRFLGVFGLMIGAVNLALILLEGSYAWFISPCA
ncbi:MAG TPA: hypothetical protein VHM89_10800 [Acidimicrobiales bacterium]|nr:hypothetical protein [Acidimicrobiales bacterium]